MMFLDSRSRRVSALLNGDQLSAKFHLDTILAQVVPKDTFGDTLSKA